MGSSVSRPTGRTSFSVISANASAALRWRSTLSEKESVVSAESGEPVKKLVVVRSFEKDKVCDWTPSRKRTRTLEVLKEVSHCLSLIL